MPKDDINYKFTENGIVYDFYDVFVPAENFRQPALWTWGANNQTQLGTNNDIRRSTPVTTFAGGTNWKSVACGFTHTLAIKTDGTLWGWGRNLDVQLGLNTGGETRSTPVTTFAGGNNWKSVAGGGNFTSAIKTDGTLWTWGVNNNGQLGINNSDFKQTPVTTFAGQTNWKQVSCGENYAAAIKTDGTLWTWGRNDNGQLGINNTANRSVPVTTFAGGTNWKSVACGTYYTTAAIKTDGSLWVWGFNNFAQLGTNDTTQRNTPVTTFAGGNDWKQVSSGEVNVAAIKTDGSLWTWGYGIYGTNGNNTNQNRSTPVTTFTGGTNWKSVACGRTHILAIKTDGTLWGWGRGDEGQLGDNTTISRSTPVVTFTGGNNWKQVSCGGYFTAAIKYSPDP
jgi:alpha-tubulin suppressor-like RCC1 family protein